MNFEIWWLGFVGLFSCGFIDKVNSLITKQTWGFDLFSRNFAHF